MIKFMDLVSHNWKYAGWLTQIIAFALFYPLSSLILIWLAGDEISVNSHPIISSVCFFLGILSLRVSFVCFNWSIVYARRIDK